MLSARFAEMLEHESNVECLQKRTKVIGMSHTSAWPSAWTSSRPSRDRPRAPSSPRGAEAVENGVKIARVATGRQALIAFSHAFHGRTLLAATLTGKRLKEPAMENLFILWRLNMKTDMTQLRRIPTFAGAFLVIGLGLQTTAQAHVYVVQTEVNAGAYQDFELRVPHGCKGSPTTELRVKMPDGLHWVSPENSHNWKITIKMRRLAQAVKVDGVTVTDTVDEIAWSGNAVPDQMFERFVFNAKVPNEPGRILFFKTIQTCKQGETKWVAVPENPAKLEEFLRATPEPAPHTKIVQPARPQ